MKEANYYEIYLSSMQPDGFVVQDEGVMEAVTKTIKHAKNKHPGLFDVNGNLREEGYPLVMEIGKWH